MVVVTSQVAIASNLWCLYWVQSAVNISVKTDCDWAKRKVVIFTFNDQLELYHLHMQMLWRLWVGSKTWGSFHDCEHSDKRWLFIMNTVSFKQLFLLLWLKHFRCEPVYIKYSIFGLPEHRSKGLQQEENLYWDDISIIFAGIFIVQILWN